MSRNSQEWTRLVAGARAGAILRTRFGGFPACSAHTDRVHGPITQADDVRRLGRTRLATQGIRVNFREYCRCVVVPLTRWPSIDARWEAKADRDWAAPANVERCMWEA